MPEADVTDLTGRLILITGASRGLGAAVAVAAAAAGARPILLARTRGALEAMDDRLRREGAEPVLVCMDLADTAQLERLGPSLYERFGRLDAWFAAAADLGELTPTPHLAESVWNRVFAVNLTANLALMRALDPLLRRASAGRAVLVTDTAASQGRAFWGAYGASKAALETLARAWAAETGRITPLRVNLVDPGPMRTRLRAQAFPGEDPCSLPLPETRAAAILPLLSAEPAASGQLIGEL
jgi:NAD(P)-dependent dehydrogenase (short-subunit alcohol dehydrogenase family)